MKIGSETHKQLFCQSFMDSHLNYQPEELPWPELSEEDLQRLRGIPFWEEALSTERNAGTMVKAFAETINDPTIREAIALQGMEEARHARLIEYMVNHYQIETNAPPPKPVPDNIEQEFIKFGYGECFDSYFAFGLFGIARNSGVFPDPFFTIFDPVIHEEARHIVFFVNWLAYKQIQAGRGAKILRGMNSLWNYGDALLRRLGSFKGDKKGSGKGFTASGADSVASDLNLEKFLYTCIQEYDKRMSVFEPELLRPEFLFTATKTAYSAVKLLPS
jgi:hypothetical protein